MATTKTTTPALPAGVLASDLKYPKYDDKDKLVHGSDSSFELWYTNRMGWCVPTLLISNSSRARAAGYSERTYATTLDGSIVRIGAGPHVLARVTVYVRESRTAALQRFIDLREKGAAAAGEIRDRISTRRAQGTLRRMTRGWDQ